MERQHEAVAVEDEAEVPERGGEEEAGEVDGVGSGVVPTAITQVTISSSSAIASEPSDQGTQRAAGAACSSARSVERVSAHPWTRAMFSVFMLLNFGTRRPRG